MMILLFFIFIFASLQAMDQDTFTALPLDTKKEILGYLVSEAAKENAKDFFSLARTCRANKQLCTNFINVQENKTIKKEFDQLRINNFLLNATITDTNVAQIIAYALLKGDSQKKEECVNYLDRNVKPGCREIFIEGCRGRAWFFYCDREEYAEYEEAEFNKVIQKKYGIDNSINMQLPGNSKYRAKKNHLAWLCCCPCKACAECCSCFCTCINECFKCYCSECLID